MKNAPETLAAGLEPERYEFRALPMHQFALGRRDFFKIFGAGLAVFAVMKDTAAMQETAPGPHGFHNEELPKEVGAWHRPLRTSWACRWRACTWCWPTRR